MDQQQAFGNFDHDSVQYHFFCGTLVGAVRLFSTRTLQHASLWIHDGSRYNELHNLTAPFDQTSRTEFATRSGTLSLQQKGTDIMIGFAGNADHLTLALKPRAELRWSDTISNVIHHPDMKVDLQWNGHNHIGIGYCKRYSWTPAPRHWGYRFIQGFLDDGDISIWTAEATFGTQKYDYFKMLMPDGSIITTPNDISCHRMNGAFAETSLGRVEVRLDELSLWQTRLQSNSMDSLLRQRACRMTVKTDSWEKQGLAINETCYGTLG